MLTNPAIGTLGGLAPTTFVGNLITALLALILVTGTVVFLFNLLVGGVEWISAGGDKGKIEGARQRVSNAVVGLVILFSFFAILNLVECFFGLGLRSLTIGAFSISFAGTPFCQ